MRRNIRTFSTLLAAAALALVAGTTGSAPASASATGTQRFATATGTSSGGGYLWANQGPDQNDDSTQFGAGIKWKLQYTMPGIYNAETRTSNAVNAINATTPGIPQQWGGVTTNTAVPRCFNCSTAEDAWLIRMIPTSSMNTLPGCSGPNVLGCAVANTWGPNSTVQNPQSCTVYIDGDKYKSGQYNVWDGLFKHEMMHCLGLAHNNASYLGSTQLMNGTVTQNNIQQGDANGIRALTKKI